MANQEAASLDTEGSGRQDRLANYQFLASAEWLAERVDDGDVRVLDVSGFLGS